MDNGDVPTGQMLIYTTPDGRATIQVELANESMWLSQSLIAELFQTTRQNISAHIANVYDEEELDPDAWIMPGSEKIDHEVSFRRYFYKPKQLRTLAEIETDIRALEQETEGLLEEILVGAET